ncbi:hypothetical protein SmJEL517_g01384 [Synchytrium microbalum]|uniref:CCAAT-binding factor domain-containing protein n=1 Tax=Synchytrium microbalum TaxID=1806994 RepID=A0A507CGE0_9FUNG|nr:uncharacterized protein SmJEL517_g01384 [Synchytrium microbalum]TPX36685.1 hypothetical protein SmJEL517_g01384 [Synchytrium microbalum]
MAKQRERAAPAAFNGSKRKNAHSDKPAKKQRTEQDDDESKKQPSKKDILKRNILELGGDDSDLDLLADVLSDSDRDEPSEVKAKAEKKEIVIREDDVLMKDVQSFIQKEFASWNASAHTDDESSNVDEQEQQEDDDETGETTNEATLQNELKKLIGVASTASKTEVVKREVLAKPTPKENSAATKETPVKEIKAVKDAKSVKEKPVTAEKSAEKGTGKESAPLTQSVLTSSVEAPSNKKGKIQMLVDPLTVWYTLPEANTPAPTTAVSDQLFNTLYRKAQAISEAETAKQSQHVKTRSSGDKSFLSTILKSGTVTDRVSALTILVQEAPLYSLKFLKEDLLEGMASKKSRREAILAIDSIKDLMTTKLLPDRKLRYFRDQPLQDSNVTDAHLLVWYFEDTLKKLYFDLIKTLEVLSHDPVLNVKTRILSYIHDLLVAKPEQEQNLLVLLVNKLGDSDRKVAAKAVHHLTQLLSTHPNMKMVVIKEVQQLLFRPNVAARAQYISITYLNQIVLSNRPEDVKAANHLVEIYFTVFERLGNAIRGRKPEDDKPKKNDRKNNKSHDNKHGKHGKHGKKDNQHNNKKEQETEEPAMIVDGIESKMMAAVLTGVNRAFPFSKLDDAVYDKYIDNLFTFSHMGSFTTTVQALALIFQVQTTRNMVTDRYYRVLYNTLLDPRLYTASRQAVYLNLLYRSLKVDASLNRARAMLKRLVQACTLAQVPFVCASLFMVGEIIKSKPGLKSLMSESDTSDVEVFRDQPSADDEVAAMAVVAVDEATAVKEDSSDKPTKVEEGAGPRYDGRKRDPLYANAQLTSFWELVPFASHFHPTVSLYATTLLEGNSIELPATYVNYDPLQNHTLARFLDRFVYKNPRVIKSLYKGPSLMQPRLVDQQKNQDDRIVSGGRKRGAVFMDEEGGNNNGVDGSATRSSKMRKLDEAPVNDESWLRRSETEMPADEVFFHRFFKARVVRKPTDKTSNKSKAGAGDEEMEDMAEDVDEDQEIDEDEIWDAMRKSSGLPAPDEDDEDEDADEVMGADLDMLSSEVDGESPDVTDFIDDEAEEDDDDDVEGSSNIEQDEDDEAESGDDAMNDDEIDNASDSELARIFGDDDAPDSDEEEEAEVKPKAQEAEKKPSRGKRAVLQQKAKALGYKGSFFEKNKKGISNSKKSASTRGGQDDDGLQSTTFASLEDFEALIDGDEDDQE